MKYMKKHILFSFVFALLLILLGSFDAKSANAQALPFLPGCNATSNYSTTTGQPCRTNITTQTECAPGDLFSYLTGLPCTGTATTTTIPTTASVKNGDVISVNYTGSLTNGTVFDSNTNPKFGHVTPFTFTVGAGQVIAGWDKGVVGMTVGQTKTLTILPSDAYGAAGAPPTIPPNSTLIFTITLLSINSSNSTTTSTLTITSPQKNSTSSVTPAAVVWQNSIPSNASATYDVKLSSVSSLLYSNNQTIWDTSLTSAQAGCSNSDQCSYSLGTLGVGTYTISVKNLLNNASDFATFSVNGTTTTTPAINVTSPSVGEQWAQGSTHTINWTDSSVTPCPPQPVCTLGRACPMYRIACPVATNSTYTISATTYSDPSVPQTTPNITYVLAYNVSGNSYSWKVGNTLSPAVMSSGKYIIQVLQTGGTLHGISNPFSIVSGTTTSSSLSTPTIISNNTTPSEYIASGNTVGAVNATKVDFNFVSNGGSLTTIRELKFVPAGTLGATTSVTVNNVTSPVVNDVADLTGLNIPVTSNGADVVAYVSYAPVGANGVPSGSTSSLQLTTVNYINNGTGLVSTLAGFSPLVAPTMTLVASKPTLVLSSVNTNLVAGTDLVIGKLTVTADSAGDIALDQIPLVTTINPGTNGVIGNISSVYLTDPNTGGALLSNFSESCAGTASGSTSASCLQIWANGNHYRISAGQSKTFDIHETVSGTLGTGATLSVTLGTPSNFIWDDISGQNIGHLNGILIYNYPTNSVSIYYSGTTTSSFPPGCTSNTGYSGTNGMPCDGTTTAPTVTISANPTSVAYAGSSTLTWSSTNATSCTGYGGSIKGWSGQPNLNTSGTVGTGAQATTTTYQINCSNSYSGASASVTVNVAPQTVTQNAPTGTLSTNYSYCTISVGSSTCNLNFTWNTTNPIGSSYITSPSSSGNVFSGNSGTSQTHAIPYGTSTYSLYNNGIQLAQKTLTASCTGGVSTWNGSICALNNYTVSTSAGTGGSISPTSASVADGSGTTFTITPNSGYSISSASDTCDAGTTEGTLSGTSYSLPEINEPCTVTAVFKSNSTSATAIQSSPGFFGVLGNIWKSL